MKKSYALVAMAVATLSASATVPQGAFLAKDAQVSTLSPTAKVASSQVMLKRADGPKKVNSVEDLYGTYIMSWYYWFLTGEDQFGGSCAPVISAGEAANEVQISCMPYSDVTYTATVDLAAGKLTIPEQETIYMSNYGEYMKFAGSVLTVNDEGYVNASQPGGSLVLTIADEGFATEPLKAFALFVSQGYFAFPGGFEFMKPAPFEFNAAEWTPMEEKAQFTDHLFNNFFKADYQVNTPVEVPVYAIANEETKVYSFCLENPYLQGAWAELNPYAEGRGNGYVVFDAIYIEDYDDYLVCTRPITGCGFWFDNAEEGDPQNIQEGYPYNNEGYKYFLQGYQALDIYEELAAADALISTYDPSNGEITIQNFYFGISDMPLASFWFGANKPLSMDIVVPNLSGVEDVVVDNSNAPVRYFNLQGVEVANPAEGQIVIKRQGSKATKVIM